MIQFATLDSPLGKFGVQASEKEIYRIFLPNSINYQTISITPIKNRSNILRQALDELNQYFSGERRAFMVPFNLMLPSYFNKVLCEVSKIPFGHTASYQDIAVQTKSPKAARAVGNANAKNPIPIIIPCHRVITSSGELGGYGGGPDLKKKLLHQEGVNLLNSST